MRREHRLWGLLIGNHNGAVQRCHNKLIVIAINVFCPVSHPLKRCAPRKNIVFTKPPRQIEIGATIGTKGTVKPGGRLFTDGTGCGWLLRGHRVTFRHYGAI